MKAGKNIYKRNERKTKADGWRGWFEDGSPQPTTFLPQIININNDFLSFLLHSARPARY